MHEVSIISFKSVFCVNFPNKSSALGQKSEGARYLLERMTEYMNRWDKVSYPFLHSDKDFPVIIYEKSDLYNLAKSQDKIEVKNSDIEVDVFEIKKTSNFFKNKFKKVLTAFIVKDKKNESVDMYVVNRNFYDDHFKYNIWRFEADYYFSKRIVNWSSLPHRPDVSDWEKPDVKSRIDGITKFSKINDKKISTGWSYKKALNIVKQVILDKY